MIVGSLADVVESTLVSDVAAPCKLNDASWVEPGVASWVYWAYNHGSNDYNICLLYTYPSPRDLSTYSMQSSA